MKLKRNIFNIACVVVLILSARFVYAGAESGSLEFYDSFEYTDSPTAHGWTYDFGARDDNFFTTQEVAHSGTKSLKGYSIMDSRIGLRFNCQKNKFGEPLKANESIAFSVWFFDPYIEDINEGSSHFSHSLFFLNKHGTTEYLIFTANSYKYSYSEKIGWKTFDVRSNGWHELKFIVADSKLNLFFDSVQIADDTHNVKQIIRYAWNPGTVSPGNPAFSWIDDVHFIRELSQ